MNETFHYLKILNILMNWETYVFRWEKWNFEPIVNYAHIAKPLNLKGPE